MFHKEFQRKVQLTEILWILWKVIQTSFLHMIVVLPWKTMFCFVNALIYECLILAANDACLVYHI